MFCENCGKRIEDDSKFCEFCGAPVEVQSLPYKECPHCHGLNEIDAMYCENCGKKLDGKAGDKKTPKVVFVAIGAVILVILLVVGLVFTGQKLGVFGGESSNSEREEEDEDTERRSSREESEEAEKEPEIDIDGTNADETVSGIFTYSGSGEGSIEFEKEFNIYAENEDGEEELLEGVESVSLLLDQVGDMVESQWTASSGHEAEVEGEIYISGGDVYVQVSDFEVTEEDYYDVTEDGINSYSFHIEDCTWIEAQQRAKDKGGNLVHINSKEEYDYLLSEITSKGYTKIQFKIGGRRDVNSQEYYWVDENNTMYGDVINSSSYWCSGEWMPGEPSYKDGSIDETYLQIFWRESAGAWYWNDVPNDIVSVVPSFSGKIGYIVEYDD